MRDRRQASDTILSLPRLTMEVKQIKAALVTFDQLFQIISRLGHGLSPITIPAYVASQNKNRLCLVRADS